MATTNIKHHLRSISLPSRSHPSTIRVHEELNKLKTWESLSSSSSLCTALSFLHDLHICLDDLLRMSSTQQAISHHQHEKPIEELLEASLRVLDVCGITRDTLLQIKEHVQSLHSALRRRKGGFSSVQKSVAEYQSVTKKIKKKAKTVIATLKHMEIKFKATPVLNDLDDHVFAVIRVIREVIAMNISIFQSLLAFLVTPFSSPKVSSKKWLKWMHKGVVVASCEDDEKNSENVNELKSVDLALRSIINVSESGLSEEKMKDAHGRLEALEMAIEGLENRIESVFRRLIKTRASLLNIISQ